MTPNYFRWVKTGDSTTSYDGYTLEHSESFEGTGFGIYSTAPDYSDLEHTEVFLKTNESGDWPNI
tara:strand:- start:284 stop:478 length:195 start_codon:yes stop_codon:yes gene_type:complete